MGAILLANWGKMSSNLLIAGASPIKSTSILVFERGLFDSFIAFVLVLSELLSLNLD